MAFDGAFLYKTVNELKSAIDCHIDKIYQPTRDELVFLLRKKGFVKRLLVTVKPGTARIHFTENKYENPAFPPNFCMLLRKYLSSAKLTDIIQPDLERVAELLFTATNELGDIVKLRLVCELIGNQANAILVKEDGRIIDSIKHSDIETAKRLILPGAVYEYPPLQEKLNPLNCNFEELYANLNTVAGDLTKKLLSTIAGFSPLVCREIEAYTDCSPDGTLDKSKLKKQLNIKGEEQTQSFCDALDALVEEGSLFFDEKKGYRIFNNELGFAYGEVEINKLGNGFVHNNDGYTIFIESADLNGALHGDKVLVSSIEFGRRDQFKGKIHKVLKRKSGNVVFEVIGNGMSATLVPYNKNEYVNINVNKNQLKNLIDGEYVLVKIGSKKIEEDYIAEIKKVIGHRDDANIDIKLIYEKYDVPTEFSKEALEEAENLPNEVTEKDIEGRVDLRNKNFITIDCDNTKDRDDAVYIEQLENGNYKLYVSISSVNYYVKRDTNLFKEALARGNSYYHNSPNCKYLQGADTDRVTEEEAISNGKHECNCVKYGY